MIGLFLLSYWRYAAGAAVVVAAGLYLWHLDDAIYQRGFAAAQSSDQTIIDRLTSNNAVLNSNIAMLSASLDTQNAAVAAWKTRADQNAADGAAALAKLHTASMTAAAQSARILATKPGTNLCDSADALILGSLAP